MQTHRPATIDEVKDLVAEALAKKTPLEVMGHGTKRWWGHPIDASECIKTTDLDGILEYHPSELVMTCAAGTPVQEVQHALAEHGQVLAFEPPRYSRMGNSDAENNASIGGVFATNSAGSCRLKTGAARDYLLGFRAVSGRAEIFKAGGKVMKNVTGYDLTKLLCGSFGTLGIMTEVSFKVLPQAPFERTLFVSVNDIDSAFDLIRSLSNSSVDVHSLCYLPAHLCQKLAANEDLAITDLPTRGAIACRLLGTEAGIASRASRVTTLCPPHDGRVAEQISAIESTRFWQDLGELTALRHATRFLAKVSAAPSVSRAISRTLGENPVDWFVDASGNWLWLSPTDADDTNTIRSIVNDVRITFGKSAGVTVINCPTDDPLPRLSPLDDAKRGLHRRLKHAFDPHGILNAGRLYPEF